MLIGVRIGANYTSREACSAAVCCRFFILYIQSLALCTNILQEITCNPVRLHLASLVFRQYPVQILVRPSAVLTGISLDECCCSTAVRKAHSTAVSLRSDVNCCDSQQTPQLRSITQELQTFTHSLKILGRFPTFV